MAAPQMSGPSVGTVPSPAFEARPGTQKEKLDEKLSRLKEHQRAFARAPAAQKAAWVKELQQRFADVAEDWVLAACKAKGIAFDAPVAGEEWIAGPALTIRNCRLLARALIEISEGGKPALDPGGIRDAAHGGLAARITPYDGFDAALLAGITAETWLPKGIVRADVSANQAVFYERKDPEGGVSLILGAGNVASIPPMDALYKMFVEGKTCLIKMNPVNEYLGPFFERAFAPLIDRGFVDVVYGGGAEGAYLCSHDAVDEVHITGSDKTHDTIVWGTGAERERRKAENDPILKKPITSELGNVSPVLVVPGPYDDAEIAAMAENIAGMVTNNASFNCNAAKLLVLPKGWPLRQKLLDAIARVLSAVPPRRAYYPGASDRYRHLTEGRSDVQTFGDAAKGELPWTLVTGLDAKDPTERNFYTEPFCALISEVEIGSADPAGFLAAAIPFVNDQVWGTLSAMLFVHPTTEKDPSLGAAVTAAIRDLRYGTVAVNVWPALAYALVTAPWGGHPSASLVDIQSGLGWVHNTVMFDRIEKCIVRGPLKGFPKPVYFPSHRTLNKLGKKLVAFEASPSWLKVPGMAVTAMGG